jgi:predicted HTH domain antitoxin
MSLVISDDLLKSVKMSEEDLMKEIIIMLFQQEKISLGKAANLLNISQLKFQKILANRNLFVHYDLAEWEEDLETLREMGWL